MYYYHIWSGVPAQYIEILFKIRRKLSNEQASQLKPRCQRHDIYSLFFFYKYLHGIFFNEILSLVPRIYEFKRATRLSSETRRFIAELNI